jgi:hypothetical protein
MPRTQQLAVLHRTTLHHKSYLVNKHIRSVLSRSHLLHTAAAHLGHLSRDRIHSRSMSTHMTSTYRGQALSHLLCRPRMIGSVD